MAQLKWIRQALMDRRIPVVAERTGLSEPTIRAIRDGKNTNPTLKTLETLANYLIGDGE